MTISPDLTDRMVALVRTIAEVSPGSAFAQSGYASEARDIAKLLPDPDLEAAKLIAQSVIDGKSEKSWEQLVAAALGGIKHGRETAK